MSTPVVLAIETSQRTGGVALQDPSGGRHVEMLRAAKRHDDDLLPAIDRVFTRLGLRPRDLGAVGVCVGPGGFTGLRIAISTAKMFAEALGAAVVAVPGALVAAEAHDGGGLIGVALGCKRSTWWHTRLERGAAGAWAIAGTPGLAEAESFTPDALTAMLADEFFPAAARASCDAAGVAVHEPRFEPGACLAVTLRQLAAERTTEADRLEPLYARPPEAVTLWQAREGGGGAVQ